MQKLTEVAKNCKKTPYVGSRSLIKVGNLAPKSLFIWISDRLPLRSHLDYASAVWWPYKIVDIEVSEKIQKRATMLVTQLKKLPYTERLKELDLHTLKYRRIRGDMTKIFKIVPQKYDPSCSPTLQFNNRVDTRGNKYKLLNKSSHYDMRKY